MTPEQIKEIVYQRIADPEVLGRIASNLRDTDSVQQREIDGRHFHAAWQDSGGTWRCTVNDTASGGRLIKLDLQDDGTVRVEVDEPCRVTVSPEEGILCITRYKRPA